ncbi:MAG: cytochrome c [Deferribacteres bacterium]|nr:cytochrome c [Deferribacteres bacterium]
MFKQVCVACHTINQGKLVGPDLADVHTRRSEEWLLKFIKSSQSVVNSGDPVATVLFEEFNKIPMPDNNFTDDQIRKIIAYIASNSPGGPGAGVAPEASELPPDLEGADERNGEKLFTGAERLASGGPSCITCHNVKNDNLITGGVLAVDLTEVYTRIGIAGVQAILGSPPFPAMREAYSGKSLEVDEIKDLTAFLKLADEIKKTQEGTNYGMTLLFSGFGGAFVLLLLFGGLLTRTKRGSVNQEIYARQIKSI